MGELNRYTFLINSPFLFLITVCITANSSPSYLKKIDIQEGLFKADHVSIKIDSVLESVWWKINRPQNTLNLSKIIESIEKFSQHFKDDLLTETTLIEDINDFVYTGNLEDELLSTLSVHSMREEAIESFIEKSMTGWSILHKLLTEKKLVEVEYAGNKFYQRNFASE